MHIIAAKTQLEKDLKIKKSRFWPIKKAEPAVFQPQKSEIYQQKNARKWDCRIRNCKQD